MSAWARGLCSVLLLLSLSRCDGGDSPRPLGYTAHLLIEIDGAYRGDYCIAGRAGVTTGLVSARFSKLSADGFDVGWHGEDGSLELQVEDDLEDQVSGVSLFHETFDTAFGATRQVRRLETEYEAHHVVIYVEGLAQDGDCSRAEHDLSDYPAQSGNSGASAADGGVNAADGGTGSVLAVPWLLDIHGTGPDDVWAVGFDGVVLHYDGERWLRTVDDASVDLLSVFASARDGDVWLVARTGWAETEERQLLRGRPGSFHEVDAGLLPGELVERPWGTGPNDLWLTGYTQDELGKYGVVHHYDGKLWSIVAQDLGGRFAAIWGSGSDDVFVAGDDGSGTAGCIAHFASGHFDATEYPDSWIGGMWGSAPNDVWAAGGQLLHFDGSVWTTVQPPPNHYMFHGVWGSRPADFWAVGNQGISSTGVTGVILHWDGAAWTEAAVTPTNELRSVWGSDANDVWAVGSGSIYHFDGATWAQLQALASAP